MFEYQGHWVKVKVKCIFVIICCNFQRLASLLYAAAADGGYVDPVKVHDILGVPIPKVDEKGRSTTEDISGTLEISQINAIFGTTTIIDVIIVGGPLKLASVHKLFLVVPVLICDITIISLKVFEKTLRI